ncbi:MAG TPA: hypothetical protein VF691_10655 [Cytophagaceae bacterium]|jgi:hypothetical protein
MDRLNDFQDRIDKHKVNQKKYQAKSDVISWIRTGCAILLLVCVYFLFKLDFDWKVFLAMGVIVSVFIFLVKQHQKIKYQLYLYTSLIKINEEEIMKLEGNLERIPSIAGHDDKLHFYTSDLDIFGAHSLFTLLNRAETMGGKTLLASWLKKASSKQEILARQKGVEELSGLTDWRQEFQAHGQQIRTFKNHDENRGIYSLLLWAGDVLKIRYHLLVSILIKAIPAALILVIALCFIRDVSFKYTIPFIIANGIILKIYSSLINKTKMETGKAASILGVYKNLFKSLEAQHFHSDILARQKKDIVSGDSVVSSNISQLEEILFKLEATYNPYFAIVGNYFLLWDMHALFALNKWKGLHGPNISKWTNAIHHIESISSLAGTMYANPDWVFPAISDEKFVLTSLELGHPLIRRGKRVSNNFSMTHASDVYIITGSNMSGKSTFLRTLGINSVMAFAGAPVCARSMEVSIFNLFTSMRTNDSLEEDTSSFYAELKRLKQLIDFSNTGNTTFYMLDEILKGTNSKDRHEGTKALIKQLMNQNNFGIISTHDLELGNMENQYPEKIKNYSFNSYMEQGRLVFDYTIRDGVCKSFNASDLMKQIGIRMDSL